MTDLAPMLQAFRALPRKDQDTALLELAKHVIADRPDQPTIRLADETGWFVGFSLNSRRANTKPRPLSEKERAENARRMANLGDTITVDELMSRLDFRGGHREPE